MSTTTTSPEAAAQPVDALLEAELGYASAYRSHRRHRVALRDLLDELEQRKATPANEEAPTDEEALARRKAALEDEEALEGRWYAVVWGAMSLESRAASILALERAR